MAGGVKNREKAEMLAGIFTMAVAILLLVAVVLIMTQCDMEAPETTDSTVSQDTRETQPPEPTLRANPYNSGDFACNNGYLTCISGKSILGIDVSSHQGIIDWAQVAGTDVKFVMVRIGYRGYMVSDICEDSMWRTNVAGAKENGLMVGAYFFSQAISVEEALEEAAFVLQQLDGMALDLPVVFDWEPIGETTRTAQVDAQTLNACAIAFCEAIRKAGYEPMVYFNIDLSSRLLDLVQMQQQGYPFWLAMYSTQMTYPYRVDMWQYTNSGSVAGIDGDVDLNLLFSYGAFE